MKTSLWLIPLLTVISLFAWAGPGQPTSELLSPVAERALAEGKDGKLNAWFAQSLGLKAQQPLPLKRLQFEKDGATNMLNVLLQDPNTIILSERRKMIGTFYLTDRAGNLKRAIVNDGAIADGGMTNLTQKAAAAGFEKQKQFWVQQQAH